MRSWNDFVNDLAWTRGSLDDSSYRAFLRAASLGISPDDAIRACAHRIQAAGDTPRIAKLRSQCERAYQFARADAVTTSSGAGVTLARPIKRRLNVDFALVRELAKKAPAITPQWLRARSPRDVLAATPVDFLYSCYRMGDRVIILTDPRAVDGTMWENFSLHPRWNELDRLRFGHPGVWFMVQPVDGQWHWNPRQQRESRRSEEAVIAWRYAVLESDKVAGETWLRILVQLPLPISAIYSSGGDSIHALVRIDAESKEHWDQIMRRKLLPILAPLGADPGTVTAVRLSRLPACERGATGKMQELYYLNPTPEAEPLL